MPPAFQIARNLGLRVGGVLPDAYSCSRRVARALEDAGYCSYCGDTKTHSGTGCASCDRLAADRALRRARVRLPRLPHADGGTEILVDFAGRMRAAGLDLRMSHGARSFVYSGFRSLDDVDTAKAAVAAVLADRGLDRFGRPVKPAAPAVLAGDDDDDMPF